MGIKNTIIMPESVTHFDELATAPERSGESRSGYGTQQFYDWIVRRLPPGPIRFGSKVYVTRQPWHAQRLLCL